MTTYWIVYSVMGDYKDGELTGTTESEHREFGTIEEAKKFYDVLCTEGYDWVYLDSMEYEDGERCQDCVECWENENIDKGVIDNEVEICPRCGEEWTSNTRCDCPNDINKNKEWVIELKKNRKNDS